MSPFHRFILLNHLLSWGLGPQMEITLVFHIQDLQLLECLSWHKLFGQSYEPSHRNRVLALAVCLEQLAFDDSIDKVGSASYPCKRTSKRVHAEKDSWMLYYVFLYSNM